MFVSSVVSRAPTRDRALKCLRCFLLFAGALKDEKDKSAETLIEDMFIRKFMTGTFHNIIASDLIIKRRMNIIFLAFLAKSNSLPRKMYFLTGYTEELLSFFLKKPVKIEIQTVKSDLDLVFKMI